MAAEATTGTIFPRRDNPYLMRLLRAVQSSFDLRKAILAGLGLLILHAGWDLFELGLPGARGISPHLPGRPGAPVATAGELEEHAEWQQIRGALWRLTEPVRILAGPLISLFEPGKVAMGTLRALFAVVWVIVVWGIMGGAIARMAVVVGSSRPGPGLVGSIRFALRFAVPMIVTPLCPLLAVGLCALVCAGVGVVFWLPDPVGSVVGGTLLFIPLGLGLVMVLLVFGLVASWPLLHASIAADAQDVLDALSRCFSYLNQRLGKFALCVLLAWVIGVPALVAVQLLASGVIHLAAWGLSLSAPASSIVPLDDSVRAGTGLERAGMALPAFWRGAVGLLAQGWIYAYFWTVAAHIYLLLREDVDGTPWTEVSDPPEREKTTSP